MAAECTGSSMRGLLVLLLLVQVASGSRPHYTSKAVGQNWTEEPALHSRALQEETDGGAPVWPPYVRGKDNYKWCLSEFDRENGISYLGAASRLRKAVAKLMSGETLKVTTLGGSITAGQGCPDAPNWPQYLFNFLGDQFAASDDAVKGINGAVGGTISGYMSVCHNLHVPKDVDIVFVEYSVNDWHHVTPLYENNARRGFERLLRKLLKYPNHPAVVMMHQYGWFQEYPRIGAYWSNAERELAEFQWYYNLPALSVKAAVHQKMVENVEGFQVSKPRNMDEKALADKAFYYDVIHPDGRTGARVSAELAMHLIQKVYNDLQTRPLSPEDSANAAAPLREPMIPYNHESKSDKCFIGNHFTETIVKGQHDGWEWINESKNQRPKWGFVSTTPGSSIKMLIDTRASGRSSSAAAGKKSQESAKKAEKAAEVLVELAYLQSYEHMGQGQVECQGGCTCKETVIQGHSSHQRNSQTQLHHFFVSEAEDCIIKVTVMKETLSGEHKVKLSGIMISEEVGDQNGIRNEMAVEYVGDISARSKDGTFDVNNHAL